MGKSLSEEVKNALTNPKIINFLQKENKENHGVLLGKIEYFDDIHVAILYGITLDKEDKSQAKIFSYQFVGHSTEYNFQTGNFLPQIPEFAKYPSAEEFKSSLDEVLKNPKKRFINFEHFTKDY